MLNKKKNLTSKDDGESKSEKVDVGREEWHVDVQQVLEGFGHHASKQVVHVATQSSDHTRRSY